MAVTTFSDILASATKIWGQREVDDCVLSLAISIKTVDPLYQLSVISSDQQFRFVWDSAPGLSIVAAGSCQQLNLLGPKRFELAQRFSDMSLGRLLDVVTDAPEHAKPRILFSFAFFDQASEIRPKSGVIPAVQALLPKWQLTRHGKSCWLRLNGVPTHESEVRELSEQLWLMSEKVASQSAQCESLDSQHISGVSCLEQWQERYYPVLCRGIDLVNSDDLQKLVLSVRQSILLHKPLDPLLMLYRLRSQQPGSCRFLWQTNIEDSFFGASPERLLSLRRGQLCCDALAGTGTKNAPPNALLSSEKDLREHEMVVTSITNQLRRKGLDTYRPRNPRLALHGPLVHLHTPITALAQQYLPLQLVQTLHPTPAVAGLPRKEAVHWLRTLEPFERGNYAAPIGWIDSLGNSEFRVAIRCGRASGNKLELTAGAGLVKGSIAEKELQEVALKLAVLADQLQLEPSN